MADFNATFAVANSCTLLNVGGVSALCECCQTRGDSLHRLHKDVKRRAKRTRDAVCGCHHKNVLTDCRGRRGRRRGRCC
jgi:hypothetical protein